MPWNPSSSLTNHQEFVDPSFGNSGVVDIMHFVNKNSFVDLSIHKMIDR